MEAIHPLDLLLQKLPSEAVRIVLDLGSGSGQSATYAASRLPGARVHAFECDPMAVAACRNATGGAAVTLNAVAVSDRDGHLTLYRDGVNSPSSSSLQPVDAGRARDIVVVPCTRLDTWCASHALVPDLIWCDVEGGTLGALRGLGALADSVLGVFVSVLYSPTYVGQPTFRDIDDFLRGAGLMLLRHTQSVPGQWGYAVYVRRTVVPPFSKSVAPALSLDMAPYVRGGLGDLLQSLPAAVQAGRIRVFSHFPQALEFFAHVGVSATLVPFHANTTSLSWARTGTELSRQHFPELDLPPPAISFPRPVGGRILGVQAYGSGYSNTFAKRLGGPLKWMAPGFLQALLNAILRPNDTALFFCSPEEVQFAHETIGSHLPQTVVVACKRIWDSLSMVPECDAFIGVDSSMKTVAGIMRIPTLTLIGDYSEPVRDTHFLAPYVNAGIMRTLRYTQLTPDEAPRAVAEFFSLVKAWH